MFRAENYYKSLKIQWSSSFKDNKEIKRFIQDVYGYLSTEKKEMLFSLFEIFSFDEIMEYDNLQKFLTMIEPIYEHCLKLGRLEKIYPFKIMFFSYNHKRDIRPIYKVDFYNRITGFLQLMSWTEIYRLREIMEIIVLSGYSFEKISEYFHELDKDENIDSEDALDFFHNYLRNRRLYMKMGGNISEFKEFPRQLKKETAKIISNVESLLKKSYERQKRTMMDQIEFYTFKNNYFKYLDDRNDYRRIGGNHLRFPMLPNNLENSILDLKEETEVLRKKYTIKHYETNRI